MEIGRNVRSKRRDLGLSQEAVARRADISLNVVGRIETGVITDPHYSTLSSIAEALGVSVAELMEEAAPAGKATAREPGEEPPSNSVRADEIEMVNGRWAKKLKACLVEGAFSEDAIFFVGEVEELERLARDAEKAARIAAHGMVQGPAGWEKASQEEQQEYPRMALGVAQMYLNIRAATQVLRDGLEAGKAASFDTRMAVRDALEMRIAIRDALSKRLEDTSGDTYEEASNAPAPVWDRDEQRR